MIAAITIPLILFSCMPRNLFSTMLPLEIIEITQQQKQLQQQLQHHHNQHQQQPSTQVYSTTNLSESLGGLSSSWSSLMMLSPNKSILYISPSSKNSSINNNSSSGSISSATNGNSYGNTSDITKQQQHKFVYNHHSERRRSRQMLDMLQPQGTRVLYQVGESEKDLPICVSNAVCSKIDLYETPWIERQCRCAEMNTLPSSSSSTRNPIIIHHKDHLIYDQRFKQNFDPEKAFQHKMLQNFNENKRLGGNFHLKKLMHKLDGVFQDDVVLEDQNNFQEINIPYYDHKNDFNLGLHKEYRIKSHEVSKLRHGGHRRDFPEIGGCPSSLGADDGHTITDKTRHYKLCNPIHKLPICRYFRDYTWSLSSSPEINVTEQIVHCRCPKNSITYLTKREPFSSGRPGYIYLFACSPQSRLRCQRKEPCKLFTVRKRQEFLDEVNTNPLCQCPKGHRCPKHHTDPGVIAGKTFIEDNIQTYSGYCMTND